MDGEGLGALTMRRLGHALGVEAMSIYHYFSGKEEVLDALLGVLTLELGPPDLSGVESWEERLRALWRSFRECFARHPNALPLIFTRPLLRRETLGHTEALLDALFDAGLSPREAVDGWRALGAYAIGYLTVQRILTGAVSAPGRPSWIPAPGELDRSRYPSLGRVLAHLDRDWNEQFEAALDIVIDGIRSRQPRSAGHPPRSSERR